jgi:hypothetical protein
VWYDTTLCNVQRQTTFPYIPFTLHFSLLPAVQYSATYTRRPRLHYRLLTLCRAAYYRRGMRYNVHAHNNTNR